MFFLFLLYVTFSCVSKRFVNSNSQGMKHPHPLRSSVPAEPDSFQLLLPQPYRSQNGQRSSQ